MLSFIVEAGVNDPARYGAHIALAQWDVAEGAAWPDGAAVGSSARRQRIYDLLKLGNTARTLLDEAFPSQALVDSVITSDRWDPWYTTASQERDFYWKAYKGVLEGNTATRAREADVGMNAAAQTDPAVHEVATLAAVKLPSERELRCDVRAVEPCQAPSPRVVSFPASHRDYRSRASERADAAPDGGHSGVGRQPRSAVR